MTKTVGVRFQLKDKDILESVCKARGEDVSDFIRRAVKTELARLSFYSAETKKALGVRGGDTNG